MEKRLKKEEQKTKVDKSQIVEDATKYGEFVSTYFAWITIPEQKEIAEKLQKITKNGEKEQKSKKKEK